MNRIKELYNERKEELEHNLMHSQIIYHSVLENFKKQKNKTKAQRYELRKARSDVRYDLQQLKQIKKKFECLSS